MNYVKNMEMKNIKNYMLNKLRTNVKKVKKFNIKIFIFKYKYFFDK
jgi:hypothetical protein